jgi:hypothetical protein
MEPLVSDKFKPSLKKRLERILARIWSLSSTSSTRKDLILFVLYPSSTLLLNYLPLVLNAMDGRFKNSVWPLVTESSNFNGKVVNTTASWAWNEVWLYLTLYSLLTGAFYCSLIVFGSKENALTLKWPIITRKSPFLTLKRRWIQSLGHALGWAFSMSLGFFLSYTLFLGPLSQSLLLYTGKSLNLQIKDLHYLGFLGRFDLFVFTFASSAAIFSLFQLSREALDMFLCLVGVFLERVMK